VTSDKRSPALPAVPTLDENGLKGFNTGSWIGIVVPTGTPREILEKVARDVREVMAMPDVRDQFLQQGATPAAGTPAEFARLIDDGPQALRPDHPRAQHHRRVKSIVHYEECRMRDVIDAAPPPSPCSRPRDLPRRRPGPRNRSR
jgi:hypothetical protein